MTSNKTKLKHKRYSNIGILDPLGINNNPLTNKPYENIYSNKYIDYDGIKFPRTYKTLAKIWSNFKMYNYRYEIIESIKSNQLTFIKAGTGVGKTVLLPKFALHATNYKNNVITTIPKRIITKRTAEFAAETLDVKLGDEVGYYFQGESKISNKTKLTYSTTGSLLSKITGNDPLLESYNVLIIDEAHERSIQTDMLLLLVKNILKKRKDFKVIITSATIDLKFFINYFKSIENITYNSVDVGGVTLYPIKDIYLQKPTTNWKDTSLDIIMKILTETESGDILLFGRSMSDGIDICAKLYKKLNTYNKLQKEKNLAAKNKSSKKKLKVVDTTKTIVEYLNPFCTYLASGVSKETEQLAISETEYMSVYNGLYTRKIVVATNVAESSITVNNIKYVIDSGYEFSDSYYPEYKSESLLENRISKASAKQRRGRTGRTGSGTCYYLYTKKEYDDMDDYTKPDIIKSNLADYILNLLRIPETKNIGNIRDLLNELITPPDEKFILDALDTLYLLGCITSKNNMGELTKLGKELTKFRFINIYLARMLISSYILHCNLDCVKIVAMLAVMDGKLENIILSYSPNKNLSTSENKKEHTRYLKIMKNYSDNESDIFALLKIFNEWKNNKMSYKWSINNYINHNAMKNVNRIVGKLSSIFINVKYLLKNNNYNSLIFENDMSIMGHNKLFQRDKLLLSFYIGHLPLLLTNKKHNIYQCCNSIDIKNTVVGNTLIEKKTLKNKKELIPCQLFWSNIEQPLKASILAIVKPSLESILTKIKDKMNISCEKRNNKFQKLSLAFKPNYKRL